MDSLYRVSIGLQEQKDPGIHAVNRNRWIPWRLGFPEISRRNFLHGTFVPAPASFLILGRI
jgi:hypothetical protein